MSKLNDYDLKAAVGSCSWNLIYCSTCPCTLATSANKTMDDKPWCVKLSCSKCGSSWYVCSMCPSLRNPMITNSQISRHQRKYHPTKSLSNTKTQNEHDQQANTLASLPLDENFNTELLQPLGSPESIQFFMENHSLSGTRYLIANAIGLRTNARLLHPSDVDMMFSLAQLVKILSRNEIYLLADVLKHVVECSRRQLSTDMESSNVTRNQTRVQIKPPTTNLELSSYFLRGKHSIFLNLLHPRVLTMEDHAYCLPSECLAHFMAHGCTQEPMKKKVCCRVIVGIFLWKTSHFLCKRDRCSSCCCHHMDERFRAKLFKK